MTNIALLALEDGSVFRGRAIGVEGISVGEVVFNTSITGYQEILSDPSYNQQLITLTYPHIGNVGTNIDDQESGSVFANGLIVRDIPKQHSNWRSSSSIEDYLSHHKLVGISNIDTRRLTVLLREKGSQNGCIMSGDVNEKLAITKAREFPGLKGMDLAKVVSTKSSYIWDEGTWSIDKKNKTKLLKPQFNVVAYDFGIKMNILKILRTLGCKVTVVPAETSAADVMNLNPDGVFLSNGPGDPEPCSYAITAIKQIVDTDVPTFGICLGHQLLGLACGAKTVKMKFGHHGANHPVIDLSTGKVMISSQNHGFAVEEKSLPPSLRATHRSLFDGTLQGIHHTSKPAFSFQGHPEASPGPKDVESLFEYFINLIQKAKKNA
ncbi:MAG: glutamine-hydrolyzing carbamoyl-phosphate synthase small subunit [Pseudomonadota bacterium]